MKLYIKHMVCSRCKMVVQNELEQAGVEPLSVELGEVNIKGDPAKEVISDIDQRLRKLGFQLMDDRKSKTIEKIKNIIIELVHHSGKQPEVNLSQLISNELHQDYNHLSNLFSAVEGTTIEKYFIRQRIEKAKELLVYDELTLSEIADQLGYSSVAYLSNQFKKTTGFTPTHFKTLKADKRRNIEEL